MCRRIFFRIGTERLCKPCLHIFECEGKFVLDPPFLIQYFLKAHQTESVNSCAPSE